MTFTDHPAFRPDRARSLQRLDLNAIRAVCPLEAAEACAAVWRAQQDERALPGALAALNALPASTRAQISTDSFAFLAASSSAPITQTRRRAA